MNIKIKYIYISLILVTSYLIPTYNIQIRGKYNKQIDILYYVSYKFIIDLFFNYIVMYNVHF